ncbi:TetR family transcriptional regulator [Microbacterium betulae]|uniref:TetR family transcriptional regulator n=1 Tax=Microbacterium betulae TaxID=2981139 RepID=A0AA97FIW3_9MICO|nr:TetR family transcriptional regulator [Microbacterium sp. AB]WOF23538.1 TetR family transcriptional regulator [Microbacterium sp. AB]
MAESALNLRERRRQKTLRRLTDVARRLTGDRGFTGFTVEELCEEAGVSRRTFFNYFAAKEDAVLGFPVRRDDDAIDAAFVTGGADRPPGGVSTTLLDDMLAFFIARWGRLSLTASEAKRVFAIIDQEPRLHTRILQLLREGEQTTIALVERREDLAPGDIRASTLVHVVGTLNRIVAEEYLATHGDAPPSLDDFADRLRERAAIVRALFA